jgi:hypothetical protein
MFVGNDISVVDLVFDAIWKRFFEKSLEFMGWFYG